MKTASGTAKGLEIRNLKKTFGKVPAVDNVSLAVNSGQLVSFLGPSGCGKTTTLRMIAGLEHPDSGDILVNGKSVLSLAPWKRNCGFVFQSYALFPHMTVRENIAYGLRLRKWPQDRIEQKIDSVVRLLGIENLLDRKPKQISGGQQQRVAVARALAIEPDILLMDEPLANLDAKLRDKIRIELRQIQKNTGVTTVYVTHDQEEAFALSDFIVIMNQGKIEQMGTPYEIFTKPATEFVAGFVGNSNMVRGRVESLLADGNAVLDWKGIKIQGRVGHDLRAGDNALATFRVEDVELAAQGEEGAVAGRLRDLVFMGGKYRLVLDVKDEQIVIEQERQLVERAGLTIDAPVYFRLKDAFLIKA